MSGQAHQSDARVLGRRTLERDHRFLAGLLRKGQRVMDVGCGTGTITAGIARAVGPEGSVLGVDRDPALLEEARQAHGGIPNLSFEQGDALKLGNIGRFDVVNAARTLQWIGRPGDAVVEMARAARPGGMVVALDYNHTTDCWEPAPPAEFGRFYAAFLAWRTANDWDNRMGDRLPELFRAAGLNEVRSSVEDELAERGGPDFEGASSIWGHVIESLGPKLEETGYVNGAELAAAAASMAEWRETRLMRQTLTLRAVVGTAPVRA